VDVPEVAGAVERVEAGAGEVDPHTSAFVVANATIADRETFDQDMVRLDHEARGQQFEDTVSYWIESIGSAHSVSGDRVIPNEAGQPVPRALVQWDPEEIRMSGRDVQSVLLEGDPAIAVPVAGDHGIYITPDTIEPGDEKIISERLRQVLQVVPSEQPRAQGTAHRRGRAVAGAESGVLMESSSEFHPP
jgi:hypothetical protein